LVPTAGALGIADEYTFDAVRVCAQSSRSGHRNGGADRGVVIGFDRRFASEHFAAAAAEVVGRSRRERAPRDRGRADAVVLVGDHAKEGQAGIVITATTTVDRQRIQGEAETGARAGRRCSKSSSDHRSAPAIRRACDASLR